MYVTIVDINNYIGVESLKINQILFLNKDEENIDEEAIKATTQSGATCGYVANSTDIVIRGTHSSGFVYKEIKENQECKIIFITNNEAIAKLL